MFTPRRRRTTALAALATAVLASLTACGGGGDGGGGDNAKNITVWIEEDLPDRVAATRDIVDAFTKKTGIKVKLVAVAEDQFNQILTSNAAAGKLPDAIGGLPLGQVRTLSSNKLIDTDAVKSVVDDLHPATFNDSALKLTQDGDTQLAVPSEAWVQLLVYRKDLFKKAGLPVPKTYDDVLDSDSASVTGSIGFVLHGIGAMALVVVALLLLVVSFFAKIPGGVRSAALVLGAVVLQWVLAIVSFGAWPVGALHAINAFVVFGLGMMAAQRAARSMQGAPERTAAGEPV